MAHTILVANPTARSGRAEPRIERARELLVAAGIDHDFVPTEAGAGTIGAVRRAIDEGDTRRVIAMGGDGTFAETAKGILGSAHAAEVAMGLLPMGTANDQGKSFGMKPGEAALADNVATIAAGALVEMDVGRVRRRDEGENVVHSELFFDSFSVGLGAAVLAGRNRDRERTAGVPVLRSFYQGHLVYAGALARQVAASVAKGQSFRLEAAIDGEVIVFENVLDVIVKNTPIYGGEWRLNPGATSDDGLIELIPICGFADLGGRMLTALRSSPLDTDALRALGLTIERPRAGRRFELTIIQPGATAPPPAQIDGEELPAGDRFSVEVLPRVLRLIVCAERNQTLPPPVAG